MPAGLLAALRRHSANGQLERLPVGGRLRAYVALTILGGVALAVTALIWGIPAGAAIIAPHLPPAVEATLSRDAERALAPSNRVVGHPDRVAALERVRARLVPHLEDPRHQYRVLLVSGGPVNALALPDGTIVIYADLLERLRRPEELAGLLGHEMAHVARHHAGRALLRRMADQALLALVLGQNAAGAGGLAASMGELGLDRQAESEADREALHLLARAGVDPRGMIWLLQVLAQIDRPESGAFDWLSDHPSTQERIEALEPLAPAEPGPGPPLLSEDEWRHLLGNPEPPGQLRLDHQAFS